MPWDGVMICAEAWWWGKVAGWASHLTDLRLAAASPRMPRIRTPPPPPPTPPPTTTTSPPPISFFHPLFFLPSSSTAALFSLSLPPYPQLGRRTTKGAVSTREESERVRLCSGWRAAFISGSLHFAWRSPERRRQSETSILFFFFFFSLSGRSCEVGAGTEGWGGGGGGSLWCVWVHDRQK